MRFKIIAMRSGLFYLFILPAFAVCSQTKPIVKKTHAYYTERMPGNIPVDRNGDPLPGPRTTINYTIYVETAATGIIWDTAWILGKPYAISSQPVTGNSLEAGLDKETKEPIILTASKGLQLWKLELEPVPDGIGSSQLTGKNEILIRGTYKGRKIEQKIDTLVQLYTADAV